MGEIDITGLSVGMVVPNYRKMCELLGDKICTGKSKQCQLKRWERSFRYEREGNKFRILNVEDAPQKAIPRRRMGKYIQYIEPVLIDYLCRNGGERRCVRLVGKEFMFVVGIVNDRYRANDKIGYLRGDITGVDISSGTMGDLVLDDGNTIGCEYVYWFRTKTMKKLGNILSSSLRSMRKRGVIDLEYEYVVVAAGDDGYVRRKIADERQVKAIRNAEKIILKEMDIPNLNTALCSDNGREFFNRVNKLLASEYGWKRVFRQAVVCLNEKHVVGGRLRKEDVSAFRHKVNKKVLEYLEAEACSDKASYDAGEYPYNPNSWRSRTLNMVLGDKKFLKIQKKIADYLIKI